MIEAVSPILRALHAGGGLLLFGTLALLAVVADPADGWSRRWWRIAALVAGATLVLSAGVLALQVLSVPPVGSLMQTASRLLLQSRFGHVWLAREALLAASLITLALAPNTRSVRALALAMALAGANLAIAPLAGHTAASEPAWPGVAGNALHLLAAGAWWGALPALASCMLTPSDDAPARAATVLARFSAAALPIMLAIVGSGILLAVIQVERWPALLGTVYGYLLIAKVAALCAVLWLAARLRWRLLPALRASPSRVSASAAARWIAAECSVAALIVALAAQLAQTVPAAHDAVQWWLPFRFSLDATWATKWVPEQVAAGCGLTVTGIVLLGAWFTGRRRGAWSWRIGAAAAVAGSALALHALAVDAYPDTYRRPTVPYQTISVAQGVDLFATHCTGCHGRSARGDGPLASGLPVRPADLTEPHTALHTAGDLFWWLTHGKPPGIMPGFGERIDEDGRWDLINFLRTLSLGYQARILTDRVVPRRPWLPAIDFNYTTRDGASGTLKEFRERSAVVLVFFSLPGSAARLASLAHATVALRAAGAELLAVPIAGSDAGDGLAVLEDGAQETARSYALLRRTLARPDSRDEEPMPSHMEFLVDRYGYIRARWLPGEGAGWADPARLIEQVVAVAREPRVRASPDEHVH
jgi:putative copper resistance protein D